MQNLQRKQFVVPYTAELAEIPDNTRHPPVSIPTTITHSLKSENLTENLKRSLEISMANVDYFGFISTLRSIPKWPIAIMAQTKTTHNFCHV